MHARITCWLISYPEPRLMIMRAGPRENNHNWKALLGHPECYRNTPFGPVANYDGELIVDNPRFVKPRAFSMADKTVRLDDLY